MISIVVPTVKGREASLARCLAAYEQHTGESHELIVVRDKPTCGIAWQAGAKKAKGEYLHFTADDLEPHAGWWKPAVSTVHLGYLPCPLVFEPDGSLQSAGIEGWDCYRGPHEDWMAVEATTVPFMSRAQWEQIGMVDLHYCTDMFVSHRGRDLGYETVLRTGYRFTHHNERPGRGAGMGDQHERTRHDRAEFQRMRAAA